MKLKNLLLASLSLLLAYSAFAQAPQGINYQAVVRDAGGNVIASSPVGMKVSIHQTTPGGTIVYSETFAPTTSSIGLVNLVIGQGTVLSGNFATIDWSAGPYFCELELDPTGGTTYASMGTQQLMSVPYALHAATVESITETDPIYAASVAAGITAVDTAYWNNKLDTEVDGSITNEIQSLSMSNDSILLTNGGYVVLPAQLDSSSTNEIQNIEQVLIIGNDANGNNLVNTGKIGVGTPTPNAESSVHITTPLPMIFPSMTQAQINAIATPVEGMVQFNTDAHKLQVYAMLTNNASILNEIYLGTDVNDFIISQFGTSPIDGQIIAVELLLKDDFPSPIPLVNMSGQGSFTVPSYGSFTWFTFVLPNPIPVTAGGFWNIDFIGPGVSQRRFATNSSYPDGSGCCFPGADDLLFRVHIQPNPGSYGWQNMH